MDVVLLACHPCRRPLLFLITVWSIRRNDVCRSATGLSASRAVGVKLTVRGGRHWEDSETCPEHKNRMSSFHYQVLYIEISTGQDRPFEISGVFRTLRTFYTYGSKIVFSFRILPLITRVRSRC
jgi:hypothetical protein